MCRWHWHQVILKRDNLELFCIVFHTLSSYENVTAPLLCPYIKPIAPKIKMSHFWASSTPWRSFTVPSEFVRSEIYKHLSIYQLPDFFREVCSATRRLCESVPFVTAVSAIAVDIICWYNKLITIYFSLCHFSRFHLRYHTIDIPVTWLN